ncbi:MAG: hypothetical protein O7F71_21040 [Gammaproteobacteria bacterium]|nr:hypothetical protein [Gammaproteobacteria bacterium]
MKFLAKSILLVLWFSMSSPMWAIAASDDAEAVRWFRLAAEQGYADAQFQLGKMFELGEGVTGDLDEAARWYRLAGEQGVLLAQYRLGKLFASSSGTLTPPKEPTSENQRKPVPRVQAPSSAPETPPAPPKTAVVTAESRRLREILAACAFVEPPTILEASTLSTNKMRDLNESVREYVAKMQESLGCMNSVEKRLSGALSDQDRATIDAVYNNGVDQLNFITNEFNKQVSAYKLRQRIPDIRNQDARP